MVVEGAVEITGSPFQNNVREESAQKSAELWVCDPVITIPFTLRLLIVASEAQNLLLKFIVWFDWDPMELTINVFVFKQLKVDIMVVEGAVEITGSPFQNNVREESAQKSAELLLCDPVIKIPFTLRLLIVASEAQNLLLKFIVCADWDPMELTINVFVFKQLKVDIMVVEGAVEITGSPFQNNVREESAQKSAELLLCDPVIKIPFDCRLLIVASEAQNLLLKFIV